MGMGMGQPSLEICDLLLQLLGSLRLCFSRGWGSWQGFWSRQSCVWIWGVLYGDMGMGMGICTFGGGVSVCLMLVLMLMLMLMLITREPLQAFIILAQLWVANLGAPRADWQLAVTLELPPPALKTG